MKTKLTLEQWLKEAKKDYEFVAVQVAGNAGLTNNIIYMLRSDGETDLAFLFAKEVINLLSHE